MECFICCTKSGKSEHDKIMELFNNRKNLAYPLISLSDAYCCECKNKAHNKCLININKCPTCRKLVSKPKLYVKTILDLLLGPLFIIIRTNPSIIRYSNVFGAGLVILLLGIFTCIDKNIITISETDTKYHIGLCILLAVQLFAGFICALNDYFVKYWLYNAKTGTIELN